MDARCHVCEKDSTQARLRRCPICFKHFCREHAYLMSGSGFCSKGCAHYFFFAGPDD